MDQSDSNEGSDSVAIFIVEDDENTRVTLRIFLEDAGYTIYEAPDGASALDRLQTSPQSLVVLLDWWMPGMDGLQVLRALSERAQLTKRHRYILMTSAWDAPELHPENLPPDLVSALMRKPFHLDKLLDAVRQAALELTNGDERPADDRENKPNTSKMA